MAQSVVRSAALAALTTAFNYRYNQGINRRRTEIWYPKLADTVPSTTRTNIYPFVADIGGMKEWVGPRVIRQLATRTQQLTNKDYEDTIAVPRNDILDDQFNVYGSRMELLGYQAAKLPDDLMIKVLQAGAGAKAVTYDGQPFFSANHPVDLDDPASAVQSNNFVSTALSAANYDTIRQSFAGFKTDAGRVMGLVPDTLFVPPQLETTARNIVANGLTVSGGAAIENVLAKTSDVVVIPELAGLPTEYYMAVTKLPIKPLIWQERQAPQMQSFTDPKDRNVFMDKEFIWGVDARGAAGYGMWFLMARGTAQGS